MANARSLSHCLATIARSPSEMPSTCGGDSWSPLRISTRLVVSVLLPACYTLPPADRPFDRSFRFFPHPNAVAATTSAPTGKEWIREFLNQCQGCSIGFLPIHW
jgi:hypothetical protein